MKVALGWPICPEDLESYDPDLYERRIIYLRDARYAEEGMSLEDRGLTFADDSGDEPLVFEDSPDEPRGSDSSDNGSGRYVDRIQGNA